MLLPELILAKLLARIQQLSGKLMQCPDGNHWSGDLLKALTEETGDLYAALDFFVGSNADLDMAAVNNRRAEKLARFSKWHRENLAANQ